MGKYGIWLFLHEEYYNIILNWYWDFSYKLQIGQVNRFGRNRCVKM